MKISTLILLFLMVILFVTVTTDGKQEKYLHITSLHIQFDKADAIFTVNYDFDKISQTFLLIFGGRNIEPKIRRIFPNFDYEIIKIDQNKAILKVKNISRLEKDYYLHDSQKFNQTIDIVYISDPSTIVPKRYFNINSTPNYFYPDR